MATSNLAGAKCVGQHDLFESTDLADHHEARAICGGCPAITACLQTLREVQVASAGTRNSGGGPVGTWAGKLLGGKASPKGPARPREHGTTRGYYQHKNRHEDACRPCLDACREDMDRRRKVGA